MPNLRVLYLSLCILVACSPTQSEKENKNKEQTIDNSTFASPDVLYGDLFKEIQLQKIFSDGKTFADCIPKYSSSYILEMFGKQRNEKGFDLKKFVEAHFEMPPVFHSDFKSDTSKSVEEHINRLWKVLKRTPDTQSRGSLINLPKSYIVPGGRFREIYYWDSYFTMLGLQVSNQSEQIENMLDNFAFLVDKFGFIPNGNRTYFLGRSQPPFFSLMVKLLAEMKGEKIVEKYASTLEKEYQFWMDGADKLSKENNQSRRVVWLDDSTTLNRYWDDNDTPRPESYKEDVETATKTDKSKEMVYRQLRAGAESGWDFSSRWFEDGKSLHTIHTTEILPVDLNSLLYHLEVMLSKAYQIKKDTQRQEKYAQKADLRKKAILKYCWNKEANFFGDYDFVKKKITSQLSLAGVFPLCFQIATAEQAQKIASFVEKTFLKDGGVVATPYATGQQWDAPNGWAPLQWMTIWGLRNYQITDLADKIKSRWVNLNVKVFKQTGKLVEKYNVENIRLEAGGGEYPLQDGFGWTNGVLLRLLSEK